MPNDHYVTVTAQLPYKTVQVIEALAITYGLSKANTIVKLLERAVMEHGEPVQVSRITQDGERHKNGVAISVNNELRKQL